MKKLFLIVAALFVAVSFSACSDDEDNGGKSLTVMRYVKSISCSEYGTAIFEYDDQLRVVKYTYNDADGRDNRSYALKYDGNTVSIKDMTDPEQYYAIVQLNNNGYASSVNYNYGNGKDAKGTINFTYDANNGLIKQTHSDDYTTKYHWTNGNRYYESDSNDSQIETSYSTNITPKCNIDVDLSYYENWGESFPPFFLFLGKNSVNLVDSITHVYDIGKDGEKYSYEFDNKGYISKIRITSFENFTGEEYYETTHSYDITYF